MASKSSKPASGPDILSWLSGTEVGSGDIYWVVGAEDYLRELALRKLRKGLLDPDFAEFNQQVLRVNSGTKLGPIGDALAELPMMAERRLLEVHAVHELNSKIADGLTDLLGGSVRAPGMIVVLVGEVPKTKSRLWDVLRTQGQVLSCELEARQIVEFAQFESNNLGLQMSASQMQQVCERNANGLRAIQTSLQRLATFAGSAKTVTQAEFDQLVQDNAQVQAWKLTAAIAKKQLPEACRVLHRLLKQEPAQTLLSYLNSYLLGLVQVAELRPNFPSAAAIARQLPRRSEFQIRKTLEELASWGENDLASAFERLARADYRIKTGADPVLVMQLLLLQLCSRSGAEGARRGGK